MNPTIAGVRGTGCHGPEQINAYRERDTSLLISDSCLYFSLKFSGDLPNPMLLGMFRGILQDLLFRLTTDYVLASRRRINCGTFNNFSHGNLLLDYMGSMKDFSSSVMPSRDWRTFDDPPSNNGLARL